MAVIYIAGPMTGCKDHNRTAFFHLLTGRLGGFSWRAGGVRNGTQTEHASVIPGKPGSRRNRRAAASQIKSRTGD